MSVTYKFADLALIIYNRHIHKMIHNIHILLSYTHLQKQKLILAPPYKGRNRGLAYQSF